jgi:hypothetical protein
MKLERRPENAVNWPRAVQTGVAILGACAFGAVALSYGYGFGGGGRSETYPQAAAAAAPAPNTEQFFNFTIYDMDYAGLSGDTLVLQGFPMPKGAIDTAYVTDSVEIRVEGTEVGAFVEHRGLAYSDGSARVLFTQFRANPATESAGVLCYSGCTVDSTRISEQSWTTTDTAFASINSGDSTGIKTGRNGYHPVMAFATDSAWMTDAYVLPLATIEEMQAITGVAAVAVDTLLQRLQDYGDMLWDSTQSPRINDTPAGTAYTAISILTDASVISGMSGCEDWSDATNNFALYRKAAGQPNNFNCRNGHNYYDWAKTLQQYGMMRHADSIGVEFIRRSFAIDWQDIMYWTERGGGSCKSSQINRRSVAMGMLTTYMLTGDSVYVDQLDCLADWFSTGLRYDGFGDDNVGEGEPRIMAYVMDMQLAAYVANTSSQDWSAYLDSSMVRAIYGTVGNPSYANGIWALDSATSDCTGAYNVNARPTNSLMHPLMVRSMMAVRHVKEAWQFVIGTDTTDVPTVMQAVADTFGLAKSMWQDSTSAVTNFFSGNPCSDRSQWTNNAHDISGLYPMLLYAGYNTDTVAANLTEADSMLQRVAVSEIATTDFSASGWDSGNGIRAHILSEYFNTLFEGIGLRQCTVQGDC